MKIIVSACLMGENCKYDGGNNCNQELMDILKGHEVILVCPEVMGGLLIPRCPAEIKNDMVVNKNGIDVTKEYHLGAKKTLEIAKDGGIKIAILKSRSPSCGSGKIYDGTFSKRIIDGDGITTKLLKENGIKVLTENDVELIKKIIK